MTGRPLKPIRMLMKLTIISIICKIYDTFFPMNKMKIKSKDLESPWITTGIKKSSKKKQRLYSKFKKKKRNEKTKKEYQDYKKLFESIKKRSKKLHFSKLILKYKTKIKKTWQVMKETIGKEKCKQQNLPKWSRRASLKQNLLLKILINTFLKLVQTFQKILVHQIKILVSGLRNMALPS